MAKLSAKLPAGIWRWDVTGPADVALSSFHTRCPRFHNFACDGDLSTAYIDARMIKPGDRPTVNHVIGFECSTCQLWWPICHCRRAGRASVAVIMCSICRQACCTSCAARCLECRRIICDTHVHAARAGQCGRVCTTPGCYARHAPLCPHCSDTHSCGCNLADVFSATFFPTWPPRALA